MWVHDHTSNVGKSTSYFCRDGGWSSFLPHLLSAGDTLRPSALLTAKIFPLSRIPRLFNISLPLTSSVFLACYESNMEANRSVL